jgi:hypothetical protein
MELVYTVNIAAGVTMAALCFIALAILTQHDGMTHIRAFLGFWGVVAALGVLDRLLTSSWSWYSGHASFGLAMDAISNMFVIIAAYAMYRGTAFSWRDTALHALYWAVPVLFFIELGLGYLADHEKALVWQLFYAAPSAFIASVGLALVAIAVFREPLVAPVRWPLAILFALYAYLQMPAYICDYIQIEPLKEQVKEGQRIIVSFLAATKFGLAISLVVVLATYSKIAPAERIASQARVGLSILTGALTLFIFFYRYFEFRGLVSI